VGRERLDRTSRAGALPIRQVRGFVRCCGMRMLMPIVNKMEVVHG
jgi:hypothetical protein